MRVIFSGQIKQISNKQLASGDYEARVTISIDNPTLEILNQLNEVNTNQGVIVGISNGTAE